ncbi:hypothetical protein FHL01_11555 [Cylindrospermopsis raciborskii CS-506_C]|nr:hypothetical protein [Cylindrospermopsis raciborskii]MBA4445985.1 hypothetical protein [Cylindrospermopsis raciborskii CS-506_C]
MFQAELVPVPPPLADHVITLDEPPELSQNKEITLAEKQTISTVAKDLGFILPQEELKAIASSLREDSEVGRLKWKSNREQHNLASLLTKI